LFSLYVVTQQTKVCSNISNEQDFIEDTYDTSELENGYRADFIRLVKLHN